MGMFKLHKAIMGCVMFLSMFCLVNGIGANWGTQASHQLPPAIVVNLLKDNGFSKVKLFDADYDTLTALRNSRIEVMVGIPNEMLHTLATSPKAADKWVSDNVTTHVKDNNLDLLVVSTMWDLDGPRSVYVSNYEVIKGCENLDSHGKKQLERKKEILTRLYVAVGNEPFLETYNGTFLNVTYPALKNIQEALNRAHLNSQVKVTVPLNADVYESLNDLPSGGDFRANIHQLMLDIVKYLSYYGGAFTVNIYPFISLYLDSNFPVEYAFFDGNATPVNDGGTLYYNMFDANYDTLVSALQKNGFSNLPVIVGEVGWPTDGDINANNKYAQRFNQGFMSHISGGKGTPKRPGPLDVYLFSLVDEDAKSIQPGNFERHWGIFTFDGLPKYQLNLGTTNSGALVKARNVQYQENKWCIMKSSAKLDDPQIAPSMSYACGLADCTSLGYGTSCGNMDARANISYAFNSYFQRQNQLDEACKFPNLSTITKSDPSFGTCRFEIMIQPYYGGAEQGKKPVVLVAALILFVLTVL
ncbi:hypothetical protein ACFE04_009112 [Oxalis oulophora]